MTQMDRGFVPAGTEGYWGFVPSSLNAISIRETGVYLCRIYWDCAELDLSQSSYHICVLYVGVCGCWYLVSVDLWDLITVSEMSVNNKYTILQGLSQCKTIQHTVKLYTHYNAEFGTIRYRQFAGLIPLHTIA